MAEVEVFDPRFARYILGNAELEELASGFRWLEGLVWMGDWDCLLFQDLPRNRIMRWSETEGVSVYREPSDYANGQTRDRQGRLISCSHHGRCLYRTEYDGRVVTLVDRHDGKRLNAPNDVVVKSDGTIWFSDPLYGISNDYEGGRQVSEQPPALYRFDPATGEIVVAAGDFEGPNGLAFSPDERRLYVAETGDQTRPDPRQFIRVFEVGEDNALSGGAVFHTITPGYCDGMKVDEDGNVWSSAADGVHCLSPEGELLGKIRIPYRVSNLAFGGAASQPAVHRRIAYALCDLSRPAGGGVPVSGLRIAALRLMCSDVERVRGFYRAAFGCGADGDGALRLGGQRIEFAAARERAGPAAANSTGFQHFAIVVDDMAAAQRALGQVQGWEPISRGGPVTLPAASGGATAFKFRDPEGHPLELIRFRDGVWSDGPAAAPGVIFRGIDHSAITVADTGRSVGFYEGLGFSVSGGQVNRGDEQVRLDDVAGAVVEVTALRPPGGAPPHLELLCYREPGTLIEAVDNDGTRATRLVLRGGERAEDERRDPDGHLMVFGEPA